MNIKDLDCSEFIYYTLHTSTANKKCCKNCKYRKLFMSTWKKNWKDVLNLDRTYVCTYYDDFYHQDPVLDNYICEHWKEIENDI